MTPGAGFEVKVQVTGPQQFALLSVKGVIGMERVGYRIKQAEGATVVVDKIVEGQGSVIMRSNA